jgi:hypothetical protein
VPAAVRRYDELGLDRVPDERLKAPLLRTKQLRGGRAVSAFNVLCIRSWRPF